AFKSRTLEGLLREKFFTRGLDQEGAGLAHELAISAQRGRVLFVLDGLDEIAKDTRCEDGVAMKDFLRILLQAQHVVITSRPSGLDRSLLPPSIDLELETIGFSPQNVQDFLFKVLTRSAAATVQRFIQQTPLIQGLVNIPVQLDVICYSWDSLPTDGPAVTMTALYQLMVRKLWCKDALRLRKSAEGETLTQEDINQLEPQEIDELMATEMQHLGYLAFKGLTNDHQIEFDGKALLTACRDLKKYRATGNSRHVPPQMLEIMKQTSFLHTADADLDASTSDSEQAWYFLHLTFQEYFAATWVAQHLQQPIPTGMQDYFSCHHRQQPLPAGMMTVEQARAFVQEQKYNPRYEIMWWMVAGLLEGEALQDFFDLLQGVPRDLIGTRHQQILASCLDEARARLDTTVVTKLDAELTKWMHFEIRICCNGYDRSMLGSQNAFPETLLFSSLSARISSKAILVNTLGSRSTLSDEAIRFLVSTLKDEDSAFRTLAAKALGNQSALPKAVILSLVDALKDEDNKVRSSAAAALGNQSTLTKGSIQSLIRALKDENEGVRWSAARAMGNQPTLSKAATQPLISALNDKKNADVRVEAAWVLSSQFTLSDAAIQSLTGALKVKNARIRSLSAKALGNQSTLSEAAIQSLIGALKDDNVEVRQSAAKALGNQSTFSEAAMQSLSSALKDQDARLKSFRAPVFGTSEADIRSIISALKDEEELIRSYGASVLGRNSTVPEAAIQSFICALNDKNVSVRAAAASALSDQFTWPNATIHLLTGAVKDEHACMLPEAAIQSLTGALKDQNGYVSALQDDEVYVKQSAAAALDNQSTLSEVAVQALIVGLSSEDALVGRSAESALSKQSTLSKAAIQILIGVAGMSCLYKYTTVDCAFTQSKV
ncbi:hypothetical protein BGZ70_002812, partial [Mortierella alpina]